MIKSILEKYTNKIRIKEADNLIKAANFNEIEIQPDFDARTLKNLQRASMVRKKNESGEFEEVFDIHKYQSSLIQMLCKFDGKQITAEEIERFEKGFYADLVKLLTAGSTAEE